MANEYQDLAEDVLNDLEGSKQPDTQGNKNLNEALLRVEMSNLYIHLVKNDYFQAGSATKVVLDKVNKEVQQFAMDRLQELLGIKKPADQVAQSSAFTPNETAALKALSSVMLSKKEAPKTKLGENKPISTTAAPAAPARKIVPTAPPVMSISSDEDDTEDDGPTLTPPPKSNMTSEERLKARKKIRPHHSVPVTAADKLKALRISSEPPMIANASDGGATASAGGIGLNDLVAGALNDR